MNASEFYRHFEESFSKQALPSTLEQARGKTPTWTTRLESGSLRFKLATDFKGAGLLAQLLWPGEHRMSVTWIVGRGAQRKVLPVSLFQYTTSAEVQSFTEIARGALRKYLAANGPDPYGTLREYLTTDLAVPKPNIDTFYFHFDATDAQAWGEWYGQVLGPWIARFAAMPESNDAWASRVLWPIAKVAKGSG